MNKPDFYFGSSHVPNPKNLSGKNKLKTVRNQVAELQKEIE